ncbi:hypothetical protein [Priestia aryabhattai]
MVSSAEMDIDGTKAEGISRLLFKKGTGL